MPSTEQALVVEKTDFSNILNHIRQIQEELLYASFYREKKEFSRGLDRLSDKYWELYATDSKSDE